MVHVLCRIGPPAALRHPCKHIWAINYPLTPHRTPRVSRTGSETQSNGSCSALGEWSTQALPNKQSQRNGGRCIAPCCPQMLLPMILLRANRIRLISNAVRIRSFPPSLSPPPRSLLRMDRHRRRWRLTHPLGIYRLCFHQSPESVSRDSGKVVLAAQREGHSRHGKAVLRAF